MLVNVSNLITSYGIMITGGINKLARNIYEWDEPNKNPTASILLWEKFWPVTGILLIIIKL